MAQTCNFCLISRWFSNSKKSCELFSDEPKIEEILTKSRGKFEKITCGLPAVENSEVCILHKCSVKDCYERRLNHLWNEKLLDYCDKHNCGSGSVNYGDSCNKLCVDGSRFCDKHKCKVCEQHIYRREYQYCEKHLEKVNCMKCKKEVTQKEGENLILYCDDHLCEFCQNSDKKDNSKYCFGCACHFDGCNEHIKERKQYGLCVYCEEHENTMCKKHFCKKQKISNFDYCEKHKCAFSHCSNRKYECEDSCPDFCYDHDKLNDIAMKYGFEINDENLEVETNEMLKKVKKTILESAKNIC